MTPNQNAAMLWTGGKDSSLALYEAGHNGYCVRCLVTFAPPQPNFLAHPLPFVKMQAESLGLSHYIFPVCQPFEDSYETGLRRLRGEMDIHTVITGDIADGGGSANWIRERSGPVGMRVHTPSRGRDRRGLLRQMLSAGFKPFFSCVNKEWLRE